MSSKNEENEKILKKKWKKKLKKERKKKDRLRNKVQQKKKINERLRWSLRGVIANALDCGHEVNEFELQSRYYVFFRIYTLVQGMNPSNRFNSVTAILLQGWFWH